VVVRSGWVNVAHVTFFDYLLTSRSGLPFPTWFTKLVVVDSVPLPLNAILASMLFVLILALLVLGGDQAFNSIVGLLNGAVGLTYVLSIGCVLWRRTFGEPLPPARWSLGKFGIPLNIIAVLYQSFATIISFFPLFAEVTAANFNWYVSIQEDLFRRVSDKFCLQGNCHVRVSDRHRSFELLHYRKEDLCGTCRHHYQRCIDVGEFFGFALTSQSSREQCGDWKRTICKSKYKCT
jgi:amino acid transporter